MQPGSFYALPQSPQLYKQLLMVAGFDRYFQIARCFRDEDLRADRQPEFTQLDLEMSFVEEDDVIAIIEAVLTEVLAAAGIVVDAPFARMCYDEAMGRYGIGQRPTFAYGLEIVDSRRNLRGQRVQGLQLRRSQAGGTVRAINAGQHKQLSRADLDELTEFVKGHGAGGLVVGVCRGGRWMALADRQVPLR